MFCYYVKLKRYILMLDSSKILILQQRHVCSDMWGSFEFFLYSWQYQKPTSPSSVCVPLFWKLSAHLSLICLLCVPYAAYLLGWHCVNLTVGARLLASKYTLLHIHFFDCGQIINWEGKNGDIAFHGFQKVSKVRLCGEIEKKKMK